MAIGRAASAADSGSATPPATPTKPWVPTASLVLGSFDERLRVRVDGTDHDSYRSQLRLVLALGLAHPILRWSNEREWIDGHASFGLGPTFQSGHWQLPLREDATFAYAATRWLTLRAGLGLGITLDATSADRSFAEIALPTGVAFWRTLELTYRPMFSVPLGSESSTVFGGQRALATRSTFLPFELGLRVRFRALGF